MTTTTKTLTGTLCESIAEGTLTPQVLSQTMTEFFGGTDAQNKWNWRLAYDIQEASTVQYLRSISQNALNLTLLQRLEKSLPTQTRRSEEQVKYQQFSTPLAIAFLMSKAARLNSEDTLLESSAGNGLLAVWGQIAGAKLILNEYAPTRQKILSKLFPDVPLFRFNGEQIDDFLPPEHQPTVVMINPPFTASPNFDKIQRKATERHIESALRRLRSGGRIIALTGSTFTPTRWRDTFSRWSEIATLQAAIALPRSAYYKMGTTFPVQILVFDKVVGELDLGVCHEADSLEMAEIIIDSLPERSQLGELTPVLEAPKPKQVTPKTSTRYVPQGDFGKIVEIEYQTRDWDNTTEQFAEGLYEPYELQSIVIPDAVEHPCALVQSSAMASIAPPKPTYRSHLPERTLEEGQISSAQLEVTIYAGESHSKYLKGKYKTDEHGMLIKAEPEDSEGKAYRQGYFIGDGTGVGKGRELSSILMDNWLKGRRKHIFLTISPKLLLDIRRDWSDIGGKPEQIKSLGDFKQGEEINLESGIIFCTYATLRQGAKANKISRVDQLVNWFGKDFDGCLLFDESHALANASPKVDEEGFGVADASAQGLAALEIQRKLANARVVYSSATGATEVRNLAYAERLGVWMGNGDFRSRDEFISAMTAGGIASMEIIARDLKAMGLYCARSLSYEGVEYDLLVHELTPEQTELYNIYANAYQIILNNMNKALNVANA